MFIKKGKFWFFIEMKLVDLTNNLKNVLQFSNYYRDYENTWEWCESEDKEADDYINIAREHNWKHGIYSCPVIFYIERKENEYSEDEIDAIGTKIAASLGVEVYYGNITYQNNSNYKYEQLKVYR